MAEDEKLIGIQKKWNRFAEWMHCVCVVTFDLELGQAMEVIIIILSETKLCPDNYCLLY